MEILIDHGASVEARNNNKETPIQCAANSKVYELHFEPVCLNKFHLSFESAIRIYRSTLALLPYLMKS